MSNPCMVEVRHFDDDVLVLVEDEYCKTFRSYTVDEFAENFGSVIELLDDVAGYPEMDGAFFVEKDEDNNLVSVVCETCNSIEVYGFSPDDCTLNLLVTKDQDEKWFYD